MCADGASNHLFDSGETTIPKAIVGDLDSARPEVLAHYRSKGTEIIDLSHDQDSTDFEKAISYVKKHSPQTIIGYGAFGGRIDHTLAAIHILKNQNSQGVNLILMDHLSIM